MSGSCKLLTNSVTTAILGQPHTCNLLCATIENDPKKCEALLDTGSSGHFVQTELATPAISSQPISVAQPDGSILFSNLTTS